MSSDGGVLEYRNLSYLAKLTEEDMHTLIETSTHVVATLESRVRKEKKTESQSQPSKPLLVGGQHVKVELRVKQEASDKPLLPTGEPRAQQDEAEHDILHAYAEEPLVSGGEFKRMLEGAISQIPGFSSNIKQIEKDGKECLKRAVSVHLQRLLADASTCAREMRQRRGATEIDVKVAASRGVEGNLDAAIEDPLPECLFKFHAATLRRFQTKTCRMAAAGKNALAPMVNRMLVKVLTKAKEEAAKNQRKRTTKEDVKYALAKTSRTLM